MRRIPMACTIVLAAWAAAPGCGGRSASVATHAAAATAGPTATDAWTDPSYHPSPTILMTVSVAPVPLTGLLADRADQGFERAFVGMQSIQVRLMPNMIRQRMNGNRELVQIMNRIQGAEYSPDAIAKVTLKTTFTGREYADLRTAMVEPVVFFVPVQFSIERTAKETRGMILYRAFDMESGRILRQCRFTAQSTLPADQAEQKVLVDLILAVGDDFAGHFVAP